MATLKWQQINTTGLVDTNAFFNRRFFYRAKVPSGWMVYVEDGADGTLEVPRVSLTFVSDPKHEWK